MIQKNQIILCGKTYTVSIVDGVKLIDGKTIEDFVETLDTATLMELTVIGRQMKEAESGSGFENVMEKFIRNN